jgi:thiol-disulfide isomerase/thioredoxin
VTTGSATARSWWQSPLVWLAGLAVIAVGISVALMSGDDEPAVPIGAETGPIEVLDPPLPRFSSPDLALGETAPRFVATDSTGQTLEIGGDGVPRVIGFFAHWCSHCQAEVPHTVAWLEDNEIPDGVDVVAVSTAVEPAGDNYPPSAWFTRERWPEPYVLDDADGTLATAYGLSAFPYWVAVDAQGEVVFRITAELSDEQFEAMLASVTP